MRIPNDARGAGPGSREGGTAPRTAPGAKRRDTILVLDFGGQYCHLIARSVRESGVYSEIAGHGTTAEKVSKLNESLNIRGIILSGGPQSVYDSGAPSLDAALLRSGIPVLGLCYGHQLIAHLGKGSVRQALRREYGEAVATVDSQDEILKGLKRSTTVWMSHGDTVYSMPEDYEVLAHTGNTPVAAFRHRTMPIFGLQWHPEVVETEEGQRVLRNFVLGICKCSPDWDIGNFADSAVDSIRAASHGERCIMALSGGVDSSVTAALAAKALGSNLTAVYVDTGLMREGETRQISDAFGDSGLDLRIVDAGDRFMAALAGVSDPEEKRKIIGGLFVRVFEEVARETSAGFLVQGTIYPDRVESGAAGASAKIKTHHNVGGMPKNMFKGIIEPLRDLYKDEVRRLGRQLGLPDAIVDRQPFPGPGLAVRIIGPVTEESVRTVRKADSIVTEELESAGLSAGLWQYFAVLTDTRAVGIKGDSRDYGKVIAFRALVSREAMTARFAELPWDAIRRISTRITNEVPGVTRVVYDATDKPPGTIEWE